MTRRNKFNPLSGNPTKWSNTFRQFVGKLQTNCLNVYDHFVGLALKWLKKLLKFEACHGPFDIQGNYLTFLSSFIQRSQNNLFKVLFPLPLSIWLKIKWTNYSKLNCYEMKFKRNIFIQIWWHESNLTEKYFLAYLKYI